MDDFVVISDNNPISDKTFVVSIFVGHMRYYDVRFDPQRDYKFGGPHIKLFVSVHQPSLCIVIVITDVYHPHRKLPVKEMF